MFEINSSDKFKNIILHIIKMCNLLRKIYAASFIRNVPNFRHATVSVHCDPDHSDYR